MNFSIRTAFLTAVLLVPATAAVAQKTPDASGHWEGTIVTSFAEIPFQADFIRNAKGELVATYSRPENNLRGFPLMNVSLKGSAIHFELTANGNTTFDGAFLANGTSVSGDVSTSLGNAPFDMKRTGEAHIEAPPKNAPIAKELEGTWNGTLSMPGQKLRLVLKLENHTDGTAAGKLISIDEGGVEFALGITQKAGTLTLNATPIGGNFFSGALNAAGTMLVGRFTEEAIDVPVTFERAGLTETKK